MGLRRRSYLSEGMGKEIYVDASELVPTLKQALKKAGFRGKTVRVIPANSAEIRSSAGKGRRGIAMAVNVSTGKTSDIAYGSWGGQNPFEKKPLDWDEKPVKIPPNGAIIAGSEGYKGTWVTIYIHPDMVVALLPGDSDVTKRESYILHLANYKSDYRKQVYMRNKVTQQEIESLAKRGYLKINKRGAVSITAKGKNARSSREPYGKWDA